MLQRHEGWLSEAGAAQSSKWKQSTCGCRAGEKLGAQDREDPRHSQSRRRDDKTSGSETVGDVVRAVEHQAWPTEFSSKADDWHRVHLTSLTTASEIAFHCGAMQET